MLEYAYTKILNMAKGSQYTNGKQRSGYPRIYLGRVLNIWWILNMLGFWIWQGSEQERDTQGS